MKTRRVLAYINLLTDLIDKDIDEFAKFIFAKTKSQKRVHKIKSNYTHALLVDCAKKAVNE